MPVYNSACDVNNPQKGLQLSEIPAHDPFIFADSLNGLYYLYTGGSPRLHRMESYGVLTYKSTNLREWEGPYIVFTVPEGGWAHPQHGAWAPEVHVYKGRFYLFVTLHNNDRPLEGEPIQGFAKHWRGSVIAVSDSLEGPFRLLNEESHVLPETMMTLDGTFYVDEKGLPWMVYCHEWIQTIDGTIEAVRLKEDLSGAVGEPIHLFNGSEALWENEEALPEGDIRVYVTDGCQLYRTSGGQLMMLWSSYQAGSYVQTIARSMTGQLEGPWEQLPPLVKDDSGHGMMFQTFEGTWLLILHQPFRMPQSRCKLFEMEDRGDNFKVARQID
ncbi:glycoside hydrolase family 43 protein [Paenibacillus qinlingensis]|uniref:glycoside hydrolase family 43 protein n=1 Tax=Paenibacillus qinlingensis TaxID=1837343 RepID=UPI001563E9BA|nr:glycoside hydrolase family 43 protein [Paenibacillus qinlingensis]NQX58203.1 family 43 glycosylhydrolase [Paenibacillus qinlingensis]